MLFINDEKHRGWIKEDVKKLCDSLFHKFLDGEVVFYSF